MRPAYISVRVLRRRICLFSCKGVIWHFEHFAAIVMTAIVQASSSACEDAEGLRNVIRLEKISDKDISDLEKQHVVRGGPFHGVVIRQPTNGEAEAC